MKLKSVRPFILAFFCAVLYQCSGNMEPEFEVPLRKKIFSAAIELDSTGSPVILANVGLNYGTDAKLNGWNQQFKTPNIEAVSIIQLNGKWKTSSFRNLASYNPSSIFRKSSGEIYAIVSHFGRSILFSFKNEKWSQTASTNQSLFGGSYYYAGTSNNESPIFVYNDTAWQTSSYLQTPQSFGLISNNGAEMVFDSASEFRPQLYSNGKNYNLLMGYTVITHPNEQNTFQIICYSWPADSMNAKPKRQVVLENQSTNYPSYTTQIGGEARFYFQTNYDSFLEFSFRNKQLVQTDSIHFDPYTYLQKGDRFNNAPIFIGPDKCIYQFGPVETAPQSLDTNSYINYYPTHSTNSYLYHSSCKADDDTLTIPTKTQSEKTSVETSKPIFGKDGLPMILFTISARTQSEYFDRDQTIADLNASIGPSWIYLAKLNRTGKWEWEEVAEY